VCGLIVIGISTCQVAHGQYGKPQGFKHPITPEKFDGKVTGHAVANLSEFKDLTLQKKPISPQQLQALKDLYKDVLDTQAIRARFISALTSYDSALRTNASHSQTEQCYFQAGLAAKKLLEQAYTLDRNSSRLAVELGLHHRDIHDEISEYGNQQYVLRADLIDKPKFFGMKESDVSALLQKLQITGARLTGAAESLRSAILAVEPQ
jgi:hypothetical protein